MFLAPVDIHGCISFNIIVITKIETNNSHLWSCVCCYQFLALRDKFQCVCAICCNLDSQITPSTEDFQASAS